MHKHPECSPFPFAQVFRCCFSAQLDKRNSCQILLGDVCPSGKSQWLALGTLPAPVASHLLLPPARRVKLGSCPARGHLPSWTLPELQETLLGRSQPSGHVQRVGEAVECQRRQAAKMLKTRLRQPCLRTQPSCPTSSEAAQTPCVCMMAEGDTDGDIGSRQEKGSRGGQRCCQLQDAPVSGTVEQQGWMGLPGGKASGSCHQEPTGLNGGVLCPSLDNDSLALVAEPAAPPECPSPASELPLAAASPTANPSQEWKVVKIQRVLIDSAGQPRKAGKRNAL